jgi:hypothetical protein
MYTDYSQFLITGKYISLKNEYKFKIKSCQFSLNCQEIDDGSSKFLSPLLVSTYIFCAALGTDVIFCTALLVMKFLDVLRPIRGWSLVVGTWGRRLSSSG